MNLAEDLLNMEISKVGLTITQDQVTRSSQTQSQKTLARPAAVSSSFRPQDLGAKFRLKRCRIPRSGSGNGRLNTKFMRGGIVGTGNPRVQIPVVLIVSEILMKRITGPGGSSVRVTVINRGRQRVPRDLVLPL